MRTRLLKTAPALIFVMVLIFVSPLAKSHCQVPCGIYDDQLRLERIAEDIVTIEKSIQQIGELTSDSKPNYNQIVRWVMTKEQHADDIASIVTKYFMAQRIAIVTRANPKEYEQYIEKVTLLHQMLVYSMKAKQGTELENVKELRSLLDKFQKAYL